MANALQLEAARRRAVPIRCNFVARAKFKLAQPIRCRLRAFSLLRLHYAVTLNFQLWPRDLDVWPLTLNICSVPAVHDQTQVTHTHAEKVTNRKDDDLQ